MKWVISGCGRIITILSWSLAYFSLLHTFLKRIFIMQATRISFYILLRKKKFFWIYFVICWNIFSNALIHRQLLLIGWLILLVVSYWSVCRLQAVCLQSFYSLLCTQRPWKDWPHVPVLSGRLHWALQPLYWQESAKQQTGGENI